MACTTTTWLETKPNSIPQCTLVPPLMGNQTVTIKHAQMDMVFEYVINDVEYEADDVR